MLKNPSLIELLEELVEGKFYGSVTIKFESGKIVHCKKEESIKIGALEDLKRF